jgi:transposase InsO family protein
MTDEARQEVLKLLESHRGRKRELLKKLRISESTYYLWRDRYLNAGATAPALRAQRSRGGWNRLTAKEIEIVVARAREFPEKTSRLLAIWITDHEDFSVSESTVFRVLKAKGLIALRPKDEKPAAKEYRWKTSRPNEMWQIDGTTFVVPRWGYYKWIPVLDDFSRKIIAEDLKPEETGANVTDVMQEALDRIGSEELPPERRPVLLSDNGPAFTCKLLGEYLTGRGVRQIHGAPYHPQTQGKVERLNRRIKEVVNLLVHDTPMALRAAIREEVGRYHDTPHEGLLNVTPNEMYEGRQAEILARRAAKKRWTIEMRKTTNMALAA